MSVAAGFRLFIQAGFGLASLFKLENTKRARFYVNKSSKLARLQEFTKEFQC